MKKLLLCALGAALLLTGVCFAGDIPGALAYYDDARVYFGEVKSLDDEHITVIQREKIKGPFREGSEATFRYYAGFAESAQPGEIYLCGDFGAEDATNLSIWETTGRDPATLQIVSQDSLSTWMQQILNDGTLAEREQNRLDRLASAIIAAQSVFAPVATATAMTTVPVAAARPISSGWLLMLCGIVLVVAGFVMWYRKKHPK